MEEEKSVIVEKEKEKKKKKGKGSRDHRAAEGVLHHAAEKKTRKIASV